MVAWPRIFVDCTQTVSRPVRTGIPRVVRSLVMHGQRAARDRGAELVPVQFRDGRFVRLDVNGTVASALFAPVPGSLLIRRLQRSLMQRRLGRKIGGLSLRLRSRAAAADAVGFSAGDVLLLPDSSWMGNPWRAIDEARARGVSLGVVQHDFIPVRHPHLVPSEITAVFRRWMHATLSRADFVFAVSEVVARETRAELLELGRIDVAKRHVTTVRNGCDFRACTPRFAGQWESVRPALREFLAGGTAPYLTVGTIEPRKNQAILLAALDQVLAQTPAARFLLVGLVGWQGEPIIRAFRRHPAWGTAIMHFEDLSDAELLFAYCRCRALIFPSRAEGYGLPLVESLACGLRVFAADIPVHREVGGDHCVYFHPERPSDLTAAVVAFSRAGIYDARWPPPRDTLPTWAKAADRIVATALAHARPAGAWPHAEHRLRLAG